MKATKPINDKGFTLIEVILYVGIFSLIIGGIVGMAMLSTAERVKNQTRADLNYQGQAVMSEIVQSIRQAKAVLSPATGNSASSLTLTMADSSVDPTIFESQVQTGYTSARVSEGSPAIVSQLTNPRVTINNLKFTNMSVGSTTGSVLIQFSLTYNNSLGQAEFDYTQNFNGGATIP